MKKKILIAEDNPANQVLFKDLLTFHGFEVFTVANGKECLDSIDRVKPDLIIMDIQMPVMNGTAAILALKQSPENQYIKIVALTSFAMDGDKEIFLELGADLYLSKPINTREFPEIIKNLLKEGER